MILIGEIGIFCEMNLNSQFKYKAKFFFRNVLRNLCPDEKWSKDDLHRVIENLITNALKYGEADKPVTLALQDLGEEVSIIVHNFGEPIPKRDQKKIFEAFHRTESAKKGLTTGWGLGLSLVHNIVMRHEGSIDVQSNAIDGTSFIIKLPKSTSV